MSTREAPSPGRAWKFYRAGGIDQVDLRTGADLADLDRLDPKLWVALSCPTQGLEFDPRTLQLIDSDGDGRIRVPEVLAALRWTLERLKSPDDLLAGAERLPLSVIHDESIRVSARRILADLGQGASDSIAPSDTADTARLFSLTKLNGDGIVPPDSADEPVTRAALEDILKTMGAEPDRSGKPGVGRARAEAFFAECEAFSAWWRLAEDDPKILPLGKETPAAHAALQTVRTKVDDFFVRCRLAQFDPRAALPLNTSAETFAAMAGAELSADAKEIRALPLAHAAAGAKLPLVEGVNPAWRAALDGLRRLACPEWTALPERDWEELKARFAPYEAWLGAKKGAAVEALGLERVRALLDGPARGKVAELIAADSALKAEFEALEAVDRLAHYHRDLYRLLLNFVSFAEFYGRRSPAVFQAGRLFIDGRSLDLCIPVTDMAKHAALAPASRMFLLYCDCSRKGAADKLTIAAALTGGTGSEHIFVGRNGVFYDRRGRDWDATVVKVVEHPISLRQAVWSPYLRLARLIGEQVEKFASAGDKAAAARMAAGVETQAKAAAGQAEKTPPFDVAKFAGIFAAIGLAIGGIAAGMGKLVETFAALLWWQKPLALLGLFTAVSGPSVLLAWLKLRQRNLGPLLDANGWAINSLVKINIPFGAALTSVAELPPGSTLSLEDPYARKGSSAALYGWGILLAGILLGSLLWSLR